MTWPYWTALAVGIVVVVGGIALSEWRVKKRINQANTQQRKERR